MADGVIIKSDELIQGRNEKRVTVEVNIPQFMQHLSDNARVAEVEGETVGDCLDELVKLHPRLKQSLYDKEGKLAGLLNVYINKKAATPKGTEPVKDGDTIHIAYTLVGG